MRTHILLAGALGLFALPAVAETTITRNDGYIMGAGRWTCADALRTASSGTPIEQGQMIGWLMGYWSAVTTVRETAFIDTVERVGGEAIYKHTLAGCQNAAGDTPLYRITNAIIDDTK